MLYKHALRGFRVWLIIIIILVCPVVSAIRISLSALLRFSKNSAETAKSRDMPPILIISRITKIAEEILSCSKNTFPCVKSKLSVAEISVSDNTEQLEPLPALTDAEIVIIDANLLSLNYKKMPKLKWAHCTWAGVDPLFNGIKEEPHFIVTRHSHEDFCRNIAEYVLTHILAIENNYNKMCLAQKQKSWSNLKSCYNTSSHRLLKELTIGILGVGNMGQAIARLFKAHGSRIKGLGRTPREPSKFCPFDCIDISVLKVINDADYIINTLPSTPETVGLLDGGILGVCMKSPVFINVGRGDILQEVTLFKALDMGVLSHAVLDVFKEEPLPVDSMLWNSEKVTITPHIAAESLPKNIARDFLDLLLRYYQKQPLRNVVNWERRY